MVQGQVVTVMLYGGEKAQRRVVSVKENVVVICSEEEYQRAQKEQREPEGLGFPPADILELVKA